MTKPDQLSDLFATLNQKLDKFDAMQSQVETLVAKVESSQATIETLTNEVHALRSQLAGSTPSEPYPLGKRDEAAEILRCHPQTVKTYHSKWDEHVHYFRVSERRTVYNLMLIKDWLKNRQYPQVHMKAIQAYCEYQNKKTA
jgi:hypothetical protein